MYRTELEPLPLNTRATQRFWMLVVAVLSFSSGATSVAYLNRLAPLATQQEAAPAAAPRPVVSGDYSPHTPVPATAPTAMATRGCVWAPPVPATSSVYGPDCFVPSATR